MPDEALAPEIAPPVEQVEPRPATGPVHEAAEHQTTFSEYLESLLVTVILALFGTSFVVQAFKIPSQSMERTLLVGDHLLVNKFLFGGRGAWYDKYLPYRPLERGDIIVFKFPYQDHPHFVKRVIGLPGDHLKVVDQQVYVNGKALTEPYVVHDPAAGYDPLYYSCPPTGNQLFVSLVQPEWAHEIHKYIILVDFMRPFRLHERNEQLIPGGRERVIQRVVASRRVVYHIRLGQGLSVHIHLLIDHFQVIPRQSDH